MLLSRAFLWKRGQLNFKIRTRSKFKMASNVSRGSQARRLTVTIWVALFLLIVIRKLKVVNFVNLCRIWIRRMALVNRRVLYFKHLKFLWRKAEIIHNKPITKQQWSKIAGKHLCKPLTKLQTQLGNRRIQNRKNFQGLSWKRQVERPLQCQES